MDVPIAANVLGTLGAVCWSIQVRYPALDEDEEITEADEGNSSYRRSSSITEGTMRLDFNRR